MTMTLSGTSGVTYPNGGLANTTGAGVGTTDTQTLTSKTLTSPTLTTPNIDSAQVATVSGTAPIYMCRAWVNFNGTGTVAIRASGNVTSLTDNGTGNYTVNLTTSISDANYSVVANHDSDTYANAVDCRATGTLLQTLATGSFILRTYNVSGGTNQQVALDYTTNTAAVFR